MFGRYSRLFYVILVCLPLTATVYAQDISDKGISFHEAIIKLGTASGSFDPAAPPVDAVTAFSELHYKLPARLRREVKNTSTPDQIFLTYAQFAYLSTQFFSIPGGAIYHFLPGPHYALNELQTRGLVGEEIRDSMPISNEQAEQLIEAILSALEQGTLR